MLCLGASGVLVYPSPSLTLSSEYVAMAEAFLPLHLVRKHTLIINESGCESSPMGSIVGLVVRAVMRKGRLTDVVPTTVMTRTLRR